MLDNTYDAPLPGETEDAYADRIVSKYSGTMADVEAAIQEDALPQ